MKLELDVNSSQKSSNNHSAGNGFNSDLNEIKDMLRLGINLAKDGNRHDARQLLLRVTEAEPNNETAWLWLASISEYPEELLVFLQNVLNINPTNERAIEWAKATKSLLSKTFVQRGINASHENQKEFGKQCFLQAIVHDAGNEMAWLWLASVSDSTEEKMSHLQKVLNINPNNETALSSLKAVKNQMAQALLKKANSAAIAGERESAREMLNEVMRQMPELEEAWILQAYLMDEFYAKIACYEKVLAINPENEAAQAGLSSLQAMMQKTAELKAEPFNQAAQVSNIESDLLDETEIEAIQKPIAEFNEEVLKTSPEPQEEFNEEMPTAIHALTAEVNEPELETVQETIVEIPEPLVPAEFVEETRFSNEQELNYAPLAENSSANYPVDETFVPTKNEGYPINETNFSSKEFNGESNSVFSQTAQMPLAEEFQQKEIPTQELEEDDLREVENQMLYADKNPEVNEVSIEKHQIVWPEVTSNASSKEYLLPVEMTESKGFELVPELEVEEVVAEDYDHTDIEDLSASLEEDLSESYTNFNSVQSSESPVQEEFLKSVEMSSHATQAEAENLAEVSAPFNEENLSEAVSPAHDEHFMKPAQPEATQPESFQVLYNPEANVTHSEPVQSDFIHSEPVQEIVEPQSGEVYDLSDFSTNGNYDTFSYHPAINDYHSAKEEVFEPQPEAPSYSQTFSDEIHVSEQPALDEEYLSQPAAVEDYDVLEAQSVDFKENLTQTEDATAETAFEAPVQQQAFEIPVQQQVFEVPVQQQVFEAPVQHQTEDFPQPATEALLFNCPFCEAENEQQSIICHSCRAMLSLSDLEMLLTHQEANQDIILQAIEKLEIERTLGGFEAEDFKTLGIAHLNAKNLRKGFSYLHEASQLNPNDVVLSSKVNFLAIRLSEIEEQENKAQENPVISKTIMVVDDSPTVRKLITGKLEKCGHTVISAVDGMDALAKINESIPDLILLDITMPRLDGYQVCKLIRNNEVTKDLPVVMISGKDGFFDKVRGRMAGSTGYITKPFGPDTLMKTIETYIN